MLCVRRHDETKKRRKAEDFYAKRSKHTPRPVPLVLCFLQTHNAMPPVRGCIFNWSRTGFTRPLRYLCGYKGYCWEEWDCRATFLLGLWPM